MNRNKVPLALGLICSLTAASYGQGASEDAIAQIAAKASSALARLEYVYHNEMVGVQKRIGQCVCIDAANGVFLTRDVSGAVPADEFRDFFLIPSGSTEKKFKAELMGTDPEENLTFLRVTGKHPWKDLKFVRVDLKLGQQVIGVGLLGPQTGNVPYVGVARVAAKLRMPGEVIYVSGGDLTNASSPVFASDGRMVGIVSQQIPMEFRMLLRNRWTEIGLAGLQSTRFFLPVAEFAHVLGRIPQKGESRRLAWMGVWRYKRVAAEEAEIKKLPAGKPAVLIEQLRSGGPADKANVKQGDAIVGLNGKPLPELPTPALIATNFRRLLYRFKAGDRISLTLFREGSTFEAQVTLELMPLQPHEAPRYYNQALGIACRNLVDFDRYPGRVSALTTRGVLATLVLPNSPAATGKLQPGDIITHVGDKPIPDVETLGKVLKELSAATEPVQFLVKRGEQDRQMLMITLPPQ